VPGLVPLCSVDRTGARPRSGRGPTGGTDLGTNRRVGVARRRGGVGCLHGVSWAAFSGARYFCTCGPEICPSEFQAGVSWASGWSFWGNSVGISSVAGTPRFAPTDFWGQSAARLGVVRRLGPGLHGPLAVLWPTRGDSHISRVAAIHPAGTCRRRARSCSANASASPPARVIAGGSYGLGRNSGIR
jgi:hypothetical protein